MTQIARSGRNAALAVNDLVRENRVFRGQWSEAFRPVKNHLLPARAKEQAERGLPEVPTVVFVDSDAQLPSLPGTDPDMRTGLDHLVHVLYTSGSTGEPNGRLAPAMSLTACRTAKPIGFRDEFTASSSRSKAFTILTNYQ